MNNWTSNSECEQALAQGAASIKCLEPLFANILAAITGLAGITLFVMLAIGAFRYLTSGGEPKATEGAKNTMTYALLGMGLIGLAYVIFTIIGNFTGTSGFLLKFSIPDFPSGATPTH